MGPLPGIKIEGVENKRNPQFFSRKECCRRIKKVSSTANDRLTLFFDQDFFYLVFPEIQYSIQQEPGTKYARGVYYHVG